MFGADPIEGRTDRILVNVVRGGPDHLVDGSTRGVRYQLTRRARLVDGAPAARLLTRAQRQRLVGLAKVAERVFGGPQDMEFGFGPDGALWLFQARPITAMPLVRHAAPDCSGPVRSPRRSPVCSNRWRRTRGWHPCPTAWPWPWTSSAPHPGAGCAGSPW